MYYVDNMDQNAMAAHLARSDCEGFYKVLYIPCSKWDMMIRCERTVKRMGMLGVSVRKMMALTVKMETVALIGKGRQNPTCFVY
jgi:hypothetical protein